MPCSNITLANLTTGASCGVGGIKAVFVAYFSDVDWDTTQGDAAEWTAATETLAALSMETDKDFVQLKAKKMGGSLVSTYSRDSSVYENVLTLRFDGLSAAMRKTINDLRKACPLVFVVFTEDCTARVIGATYNPDLAEFEIDEQAAHMSGDEDSSGEFGGDAASDVLTFTSQSTQKPLFYTGTLADFITNYTA